jgi:hypothetical protein
MVRSIWLGVVAAVAFSFAGTAGAQQEGKWVKIVHVPTGKVLALADDSEDAGARVVVAKDEAKEARQWKLEKDGEHYKVTNRKTGKVLDVFENSKDEGGQIIQWDEKTEDNANQRWGWDGSGEERRLKSKDSGLVLDVDAEDKVVQKKSDEKAKTQVWKIVESK